MIPPARPSNLFLAFVRAKHVRFILLLMAFLCIVFNLFYFYYPMHSFLTRKLFSFHTDYSYDVPILFIPSPPVNLTFTLRKTYHHDGVAYDHYSKNDFGRWKNISKWRHWPLPKEIDRNFSLEGAQTSPLVISKLPFVDAIYAISDSRLTERHANLKKAFHQQGISQRSIDWRMKWNYQTCNSNASHSYVYQRLNLKDVPLTHYQQQRCALTMKHADVWHEMAEQKVGLALIVEDDAIFVPFFKDKFTRMIYAAIKDGILHLNASCANAETKQISAQERRDQNPMIVIGTCLKSHDVTFERQLVNPRPVLSTHKSYSSRCSHAYLLTFCSAQALVEQLQMQKNELWPSDILIDHLFRLSRTLQSFWIDPPLAYQGNQVTDLDQIPSFRIQTYLSENYTTNNR